MTTPTEADRNARIEEIRALCEVVRYQAGSDGDAAARVTLCDMVLTELDRLKAELARYKAAEKEAADFHDWVLGVCENPPPPNEKLKALFREYKDHPTLKASGTFSDGVEAAAKYIEDCHDYGWESLAAAIRALAKGE